MWGLIVVIRAGDAIVDKLWTGIAYMTAQALSEVFVLLLQERYSLQISYCVLPYYATQNKFACICNVDIFKSRFSPIEHRALQVDTGAPPRDQATTMQRCHCLLVFPSSSKVFRSDIVTLQTDISLASLNFSSPVHAFPHPTAVPIHEMRNLLYARLLRAIL